MRVDLTSKCVEAIMLGVLALGFLVSSVFSSRSQESSDYDVARENMCKAINEDVLFG